MRSRSSVCFQRFAATRADVIVSVTAVGLVLLLVGATSLSASIPLRGVNRQAGCMFRLNAAGNALDACRLENNGYGPKWDDGEALLSSYESNILFSWADLLFDTGYLPHLFFQQCPADARPDVAAEYRATVWNFAMLDEFGVGETPRRGVRTSYAMSSPMNFNWPEDQYTDDLSRQIYIIDGWWTWSGNMSAIWAMSHHVFRCTPDLFSDSWQEGMVGYRHGPQQSANALFLDGSVRSVTPSVPTTPQELQTCVDTEDAFTWLPGERQLRYDYGLYYGTNPEWHGREPKFVSMSYQQPPGYPIELDPNYRTETDGWVILPNKDERH